MNGFLDRMRPLLLESDAVQLGECARCGEPTPGEVCAFCRMWERAQDAWERRKATAASGG